MSFPEGTPKFERSHETGHGAYSILLTEAWDLRLIMRGVGDVDSFKRLIEALEELHTTYPDSPKIRAGVDLSGGRDAPLRAQMMLGKWLLKRRERVGKMAVYGGPPLPMKIARAVCTLAGMKQVEFFDRAEEGERFLNGG